MNKLRSIILALALLAFAIGANAQFRWHVIHTDQVQVIGPHGVVSDTIYNFNSISCSGNNCAAGAYLWDTVNNTNTAVFYMSTDAGETWCLKIPNILLPFTFINYGFIKVQQIDSLNIVAITDSGVVVRTFDGGKSWERQQCPTPYKLSDVHFSDPFTGIISGGGTKYQLFITSDGGRHWNNAPFSGVGFIACHSYGNGKFRFMKYALGPLYTTLDNFKTVDSTGIIIDSLIIPRWFAYVFSRCTFGEGDTILAYGTYWEKDTVDAFGGYGLIMRTIDGGLHWEKPLILSGSFRQISHTTSLEHDSIIAVGETTNKILFSADRGKSWSVDSLALDTIYYPTLFAYGVSMTGDGHPLALFSPSPFLTGQAILVRGELSQNNEDVYATIAYNTHIYPNPTTGIVNIISVDKFDPIHVIDILGREVLNGMLSGDGKSMLDFSALPKGMYTISLDHRGRRVLVGKVAVLGR